MLKSFRVGLFDEVHLFLNLRIIKYLHLRGAKFSKQSLIKSINIKERLTRLVGLFFMSLDSYQGIKKAYFENIKANSCSSYVTLLKFGFKHLDVEHLNILVWL